MQRLSGVALVALGSALVVVAVNGDSLLYVRDTMTWPLIAAGVVVAALGFAGLVNALPIHHAPRSIVLALAAALVVLVVRPGPLSVDTGFGYDLESGKVLTSFTIPASAMVGPGASAEAIDAAAIELHAGQFAFAVQQFPLEFEGVAVRMIGQFDVVDGQPTLVRFRVICCASDAMRLSVRLAWEGEAPEVAAWVEVIGQWDGNADEPSMAVRGWKEIPMPERPYLDLGS